MKSKASEAKEFDEVLRGIQRVKRSEEPISCIVSVTGEAPNAATSHPNRYQIYFGECISAGLRLSLEKQVKVPVIPTGHATDESVGANEWTWSKAGSKIHDLVSSSLWLRFCLCRLPRLLVRCKLLLYLESHSPHSRVRT